MEPLEVQRAVAAAKSTAADFGLRADDAVVLHNSNRIAVRLTPCDVLARVGPLNYTPGLKFEVEVGHLLAGAGAPVGEPDTRTEPTVHVRDEFAVTLWRYYEAVAPVDIAAGEYTDALGRLHAGMRQIDVSAPHFTDRVAEALTLVGDRGQTPELADADRELLNNSLTQLTDAINRRGRDEQLLHGEPHLGNVLRTDEGLLFLDLETCCRGPIEFDLAHALLPNDDKRALSPDELLAQYPGADPNAFELSRTLIWAMITSWRWDRDDQLSNRAYWRTENLNQLRLALERVRADL